MMNASGANTLLWLGEEYPQRVSTPACITTKSNFMILFCSYQYIHATCASLILTHSHEDEGRFIIWNTSLTSQQVFGTSYNVRWFNWNHKNGRFLSVKMLHLCSISTVYLFRCRSKKTSKLCLRGLCEENPPSQRGSNAENVSIWWRHRDIIITE